MVQRSQISGHGGDNWSVTANASNQLSNLTYDADGHVTQDQFSNSYTYDSEHHPLTAGTGSYIYDGDGNRVEKTVGSTTTLYWPGAAGGILDESNSGATSFGKQVYLAGLQVWSEDTSGSGSGNLSSCIANSRQFADTCTDQGQAPLECYQIFTGQASGGSAYLCRCRFVGKHN